MKNRMDVLRWAQRIVGKKDAPPAQYLEIDPGANSEALQARFHEIARVAHPDLHRTTLTPDELELITTAYARVTAAYQVLRARRTTYQPEPAPAPTTTGAAPPSRATGAGAMSSKALVYYRKAELALRCGDLKGAILQLKLAIASDKQSAFLRTALAEVEAEVRKIS
ncbi:MAG TPA: hypothetical protein VFQ53_26650 [Kofleriaceae bacterium]|nr:hypothetical protein [Kofleriaceae bacterium]